MELSDVGRDLIVQFEGCRLEAYPDPASGGDPWTIGIGSTVPKVNPGDTITQEEAYARFANDIAWAVAAVNRLVTVALEQHQHDPCVSLVFNIGQGAFAASTLLKLLNAGDYSAVPAQFLRWDKGPNGQPLPGLTKRRQAEAAMFEGANA